MSKRKLKAIVALMLSVVTFSTSVINSYGGFFADEIPSVSGGDASIMEDAPDVTVDLLDTVESSESSESLEDESSGEEITAPTEEAEQPGSEESSGSDAVEGEDEESAESSESVESGEASSEESVEPSESPEPSESTGETVEGSDTESTESTEAPDDSVSGGNNAEVEDTETFAPEEPVESEAPVEGDEVPPEEGTTPAPEEPIQTPEPTPIPDVEPGTVYVQIEGYGQVTINIGGESHVVSNDEEGVKLDGQVASLVEGYVPVKSDVPMGTAIQSDVIAAEAYTVGLYSIMIDSGEVVNNLYEVLTPSDSVGFTTNGDSFISVGFVEEETFLASVLGLNVAAVRGDIYMTAANEDGSRSITPFLIERVDAQGNRIEAHVIVTDVNGQFSSVEKGANTEWNRNDWCIAVNDANENWEGFTNDQLNYGYTDNGVYHNDNIWFTTCNEGVETTVNPRRGALTAGNYIISEMRCQNNIGYNLRSTTFSINNEGDMVDLGSQIGGRVPLPTDSIEFSTQLLGQSNNAHSVHPGTNVVLVDTVRISNLTKGAKYAVTGWLSTGGFTGDDGTKFGTPLYYNDGSRRLRMEAVTEFVATGATQSVELVFTIPDTTALCNANGNNVNLANNRVVVQGIEIFLGGTDGYRVAGNSNTVDNGNIAETVTFPSIVSTNAIDNATESHVGTNVSVGGSVLTDTITFRNFAPYDNGTWVTRMTAAVRGQTYVIRGKVYDKATNTVVAESTKEFTPTKWDDVVTIEYRINQPTEGKTLVVFEEILANGVVVAEHMDINDEAQSIHYIGIDTEMEDMSSRSHVGTVGGRRELVDHVTLTNMVPGQKYYIEGKLMYSDGSATGITGKAEYTAAANETEKTIDVKYIIPDTTDMADKTVVAFETVRSANKTVIAKHEDLNDEDQMIRFMRIETDAIDGWTRDHVGSLGNEGDGETYIKDTVSYFNAVIGQPYTIRGIVKNAQTGEDLVIDGRTVTQEVTFTPTAHDGTVDLEFHLNSANLQGYVVVVFEKVYVNETNVVSHENLTDLRQTLYFAAVDTNAVAASGLKEQLAYGRKIVRDTVELTNLVSGMTYTVEGTLYRKSTGESYGITATSGSFVADGTEAVKVLTFEIPDASDLEDDVLVSYSTLVHNNVKVALHEDINDFDQSIKYPKMEGISAVDKTTGIDEGLAGTSSIVSSIGYSNLEDGATYSVKGTLWNKEDGGLYRNSDGKYILVESTFTAKSGSTNVISTTRYIDTLAELQEILTGKPISETDAGKTKTENTVAGSIVMEYNDFDSSVLLGKTAVCYSFIYRDGVLVAKYAEANNENLDVKYPKTTTLVKDINAGYQESDFGNTHLVDVVTFENLTPGREYKVVTTVVDKATGNEVIATQEQSFTASSRNEDVSVSIDLDTEDREGQSFIIYEDLYALENGEHNTSVHRDLTDARQSVYLPKIVTKAYDKETGDNEGWATTDRTLVDEVIYSNLSAGNTYKLVADLYYKGTNDKVEIDGTHFEGEFTVPGKKVVSNDIVTDVRVSGTWKVEFNFDATELAGRDVVVVETLYNAQGNVVGHHTNTSDENQVVSYPYIETSMVDTDNRTHDSQATTSDSFTDVVTYRNLRPNYTYVVTGRLFYADGTEVLDAEGNQITATATINTGSNRDGEVDVVYTMDTSALEGKDIVAFEVLTRDAKNGNCTVGNHEDLTDDAQRIAIINLHTEALDSKTGLHENLADGSTKIIDTVNFVNLYYDEEYVIEGVLYHKKTGEYLCVDGTENFRVSKTFVPSEFGGRTGYVDLEFNVDTSELKNEDIVAMVKLYHNGTLVAEHWDDEDEAEKVHIPEVTTEVWDSETGDNEGLAQENSTLVDTVSYENLTYGAYYVAHATVYDQRTGEPFIDADGNPVEGYKLFQAGNTSVFGQISNWWNGIFGEDYTKRVSGTVDVEVRFNASNASGKDLVVFEKVYRADSVNDLKENMLVARHENRNDENQIISYPWITTSMVDTLNGTRDTQAGGTGKVSVNAEAGTTSLTDTVSYGNVRVGNTYMVEGTMKVKDRETGEVKTLNIGGNDVTAGNEFTATAREGQIDVVYTFDSSELAGVDVVSFELLTREINNDRVQGKRTVARHEDINDDLQRVAVVSAHTEAIDAKTNLHENLADGSARLKDTITLNNLYYGEGYTVVASLVHGETGVALKDANGNDCTVTIENFSPNAEWGEGVRSGDIEVFFDVNSSELANKFMVVLVNVYHNVEGHEVDNLIINHSYMDNTMETVYVPKADSKAWDKETGDYEGWAHDGSVLVSRIEYNNLTHNETYVAHSIAMYKDTKQPVEIDGKVVEGYTTFKASPDSGAENFWMGVQEVFGVDFTDRTSGSVEVEMPMDATPLAGRDVYVLSYIYRVDTAEEISQNMMVARSGGSDVEDVIVSYPYMETSMIDSVTGTHDSQAGEDTVLIDTVSYENARSGESYTVKGILYDVSTQQPLTVDGKTVTGEATFVAGSSRSGSVDVRYSVNTKELEGIDVVAFEIITRDNKTGTHTVANHEDITDNEQRVAVINLHTEALDLNTMTHENLADGNSLVKDTVDYVNLYYNEEYKLVGKLVSGESGEVLKDAEGNDCVAEKVFTADSRSGSVELEYTVNTTALKNNNFVAVVDLYYGDVLVASHNDLEDTLETLYVPDMKVTACDSVTNDWEGWANEKSILVGTLEYDNLTYNETYIAHVVAYNQRTGEVVKVDGEVVEGYTEFVASSENFFTNGWNSVRDSIVSALNIDFTVRTSGVVDVTIPFDSRVVAGEDIVVYAYIYQADTVEEVRYTNMVARAEDIDNAEATVSYPYTEAELVDAVNFTHDSEISAEMGLEDRVVLNNLREGQTYTVVGKLFDKATGEPIVINDEEVTSVATFEAKTRDMAVKMLYTFDGTGLADVDVVCEYYVYRSHFTVGNLTDIENEDQRVALVSIDAEAIDVVSGVHEGLGDSGMVIKNTVNYHNLYHIGEEYTIESSLINKTTGEKVNLSTEDNAQVVAKTFKLEERSGSVELEFPIDSKDMLNEDIVASVVLRHGDVVVATYNVEAPETVHIPEALGVLYDSETEGSESLATVGDKLIETVFYNNLTKGDSYVAVAKLYDKATGMQFISNGKAVESSVSFKAKSDMPDAEGGEGFEIPHMNRVNGSVDIEFNFDSTEAAGRVLVAYVYIYRDATVSGGSAEDNVLVARTEDIDSLMQYVSYPALTTELVDKESGTHDTMCNSKDVLVDTVRYENLVPGREYEITGQLIDAETGKPLSVVVKAVSDVNGTVVEKETALESKVVFTPEKSSGEVQVVFELDTTALSNRKFVAFETLTQDGVIVGRHHNINDEKQTVNIYPVPEENDVRPRLITEALDKASMTHSLTPSHKATIIDKVTYIDLDYDTKYQLHTILYNKTDDEVVADFWSEFVAKGDWESVSVEITFDSRKYSGDTLVVYEGLYWEGEWRYSHADPEDLNQTVVVPVHDLGTFIETGDTAWYMLGLGSLMVMGGSISVIIQEGKREKEEKRKKRENGDA